MGLFPEILEAFWGQVVCVCNKYLQEKGKEQ